MHTVSARVEMDAEPTATDARKSAASKIRLDKHNKRKQQQGAAEAFTLMTSATLNLMHGRRIARNGSTAY